MNNLIRTIVSGKRNRTKDGKFDLDLTYITPRIIAMSFPAADWLKKLYRNSISDVAGYIRERHGDHFFVYNMSGIEYDAGPFGN